MKIAVYLTPEQAKALADSYHPNDPALLKAAADAAKKALQSLDNRVRAAEYLLARVRDSA